MKRSKLVALRCQRRCADLGNISLRVSVLKIIPSYSPCSGSGKNQGCAITP